MNKADPKMSKGARMERKAFIAYLKRRINVVSSSELDSALDWVKKRHKRYDAKPGGLGK